MVISRHRCFAQAGLSRRLVPPWPLRRRRKPYAAKAVQIRSNRCFWAKCQENPCNWFTMNALRLKCAGASVRPSSSQFDPVRPKNKSESMGHIRKIVPVAGATQGCGQIEKGLPRRLVRSGIAKGGNHCGKGGSNRLRRPSRFI